jgi:hypothetical protein
MRLHVDVCLYKSTVYTHGTIVDSHFKSGGVKNYLNHTNNGRVNHDIITTNEAFWWFTSGM